MHFICVDFMMLNYISIKIFKKTGNIVQRSWDLIQFWYKNLAGGDENGVPGKGSKGTNAEWCETTSSVQGTQEFCII